LHNLVGFAQTKDEPRQLEPGQPIEREIVVVNQTYTNSRFRQPFRSPSIGAADIITLILTRRMKRQLG
jgi:hypothetical protein